MNMSKEALRIYNNNRRKIGLPPVKADGTTATETDAQKQFDMQVNEVTPYTTGLSTPVFNSDSIADGTFNSADFEKNLKQEFDSISANSQYLMNAVQAAQDTWDQAIQAANDAADAQKAADQAQDDATAALQKALDNAQDIVTLYDDFDQVQIQIGDISDDVSGLEVTVESQGQTITQLQGSVNDIVTEIGDFDFNGIATQVTTNTGSINTINGTITNTLEPAIDANSDGVADYYDVWGVIDNTGQMKRGAAFISNESSPGDAAFIVDANFAVVDGSTKTPVLTIDSSTHELVFNGTVPDAQEALQKAEDAYNAAETAQTSAIAAATQTSLTNGKTVTNGGVVATIKTAQSQAKILNITAAYRGTRNIDDSWTCNFKIGSTLLQCRVCNTYAQGTGSTDLTYDVVTSYGD